MGNSVTVIDIVAQVTDETSAGAESATRNVSKLERSMRSVQDTINGLRGKSKIEIAATLLDKASKGITGIEKTVKGIAGKVFTVTFKALDLVTAPIRGVLNLLKNPLIQAGAFLGISLGVKDTVQTFMDFEQSMANVRSVSGATIEEMAQLTQVAKDLGAATAFSGKEVAQGMYYLGQAGWKTNDIIAAMPGLLDLAAAGDVELAAASDIVSSAMSAFGMKADEAGRAADVFATTANASQTGVLELGESFKYAAPLAGTLGYSLEDVSVALGLMANKSINSSMAGTALRGVLARMSGQADETGDDTSKVAQAMKKLGITMTDSKGKVKPFMDIMTDMRTGFSKLSETEKTAYATMLGGQQAMSGILAIVNSSEEEFSSMTEAIYNSKDAAQEMAKIRMDTLSGSIEELSGAFETLKINAAEKAAPYIRHFVDWLTGKMPEIEKAVSDGIDYVIEKIHGVVNAIRTLTQSPEWQNAETLWDKIKVAWDKMIAEPFDKWWSGNGKTWLTGKAEDIGRGLGTALKTGIMGLLGMDISGAATEGASVGKAFGSAFAEAFDGKMVGKAIMDAIGSFIKEHPAISAAIIAPKAIQAIDGAVKVGKGVKSVYNVGKTAVNAIGGTGLFQGLKIGANAASKGAGAAAQSANAFAASGALGTGAKVGAKLGGAGAKALPLIGGLLSLAEMGMDAHEAYTTKSEEWLGDESTGSKVASGAGAFLGGTGGGVLDKKDGVGKKVGNVAMGALKGAGIGAAIGSIIPGVGTAVGAAVGAGVGAGLSAIGGENIAKFFKMVGSALATFFTETLPNFFTQTIPEAASKAWGAITHFFTETIPTKWSEFWTGVGNFFTETIPYALGYVVGKAVVFLTEDVPKFFSDLWGGIVTFFTETVPAALETIGTALGVFFTETLPNFFSDVWEGIVTFFTETLPKGLEAVGNGLKTFFTETVPNFFTDLWNGIIKFATETVPEAAKVVGDGIKKFFTESIPQFFGSVWEKVKGFFGGIGESFSAGYNDATAAAHASGGIMTSPHLGLVAEDGAEAIIPLSGKRRDRGLSLWERTGEMLGVKPYADGGIAGNALMSAPTGGAISVPVTIGNITFEINVSGGEAPDAASLVEIIKENVKNLTDEIAYRLAMSLQQTFANTPLAAWKG